MILIEPPYTEPYVRCVRGRELIAPSYSIRRNKYDVVLDMTGCHSFNNQFITIIDKYSDRNFTKYRHKIISVYVKIIKGIL